MAAAASTDRRSDITGVVLAGGLSSRFGSNKALAPFKGKPLIAWAAEALQAVFSNVLVVTQTPADYAFLDLPMIGDAIPHLGPLGGLEAALSFVSTRSVFVVACDMPHLSPELLRKIAAASTGTGAVVPVHQGGAEYLCAVYSKSLLPQIRAALESGPRSLKELCRQGPVVWLPLDRASFSNVNRLSDLETLRRVCAA